MGLKSDLFCLLVLILSTTEACFKKSETETNPDSGSPPATNAPAASIPCFLNESWTRECLNGGECYVTILFNTRTLHCRCLSDFEGPQCSIRVGPYTDFGRASATPAIVGIVIAVVLVLVILGIVIFFVVRKRRKDSRPKLEEPSYIEDVTDQRQRMSNYAAAKHYQDSNNKPHYTGPGFVNVSYVGDVNPHSNPPLYTVSGSVSTPSRKSGMGEPDEKDHSSRPSSSTGGSFYHSSGVYGTVKSPLAFHETGI